VAQGTLMTMGLTLAFMLAIMIGLSLGLLGGGGAIITLPVLVYVAGIPTQQAVGMSIAVVGVWSAAGRIAPKHRLSESEMDVLRAWITSLQD
jgi:uncharacterized membrane protein YfcA